MCSIGSRLLTPIVAERVGGKPIIAAALVIQSLTVPVLWWAHEPWMFYLFGSLFGIGFGGEMTAYLVVNRQYFGTGPTSTLYGWEMMGALLGHAVPQSVDEVAQAARDFGARRTPLVTLLTTPGNLAEVEPQFARFLNSLKF